MTNNGNRTEWSSIWSVIIQVMSKIGQLQSRSLITISKKKINVEQIPLVETMSKIKNSLILEIPADLRARLAIM